MFVPSPQVSPHHHQPRYSQPKIDYVIPIVRSLHVHLCLASCLRGSSNRNHVLPPCLEILRVLENRWPTTHDPRRNDATQKGSSVRSPHHASSREMLREGVRGIQVTGQVYNFLPHQRTGHPFPSFRSSGLGSNGRFQSQQPGKNPLVTCTLPLIPPFPPPF